MESLPKQIEAIFGWSWSAEGFLSFLASLANQPNLGQGVCIHLLPAHFGKGKPWLSFVEEVENSMQTMQMSKPQSLIKFLHLYHFNSLHLFSSIIPWSSMYSREQNRARKSKTISANLNHNLVLLAKSVITNCVASIFQVWKPNTYQAADMQRAKWDWTKMPNLTCFASLHGFDSRLQTLHTSTNFVL